MIESEKDLGGVERMINSNEQQQLKQLDGETRLPHHKMRTSGISTILEDCGKIEQHSVSLVTKPF